jgi:hypothetical protein
MSGSSRRGIGAVGLLLDGFAGYLRSERGVTELTVDVYVADIRRFLVDRGGGDLSGLTAAEVSKAVLGQVTRWSPASVRRYGCSLRSFLRYCYLVGLVDRDLSAAALPVSGRRRSLLPKGITPAGPADHQEHPPASDASLATRVAQANGGPAALRRVGHRGPGRLGIHPGWLHGMGPAQHIP